MKPLTAKKKEKNFNWPNSRLRLPQGLTASRFQIGPQLGGRGPDPSCPFLQSVGLPLVTLDELPRESLDLLGPLVGLTARPAPDLLRQPQDRIKGQPQSEGQHLFGLPGRVLRGFD